jgi:hypothetical protein
MAKVLLVSVCVARAGRADDSKPATEEPPNAFWVGFPVGVWIPNATDANRGVRKYDAKFAPAIGPNLGIEIGVALSRVVGTVTISGGGTIGGPKGTYEVPIYTGTGTVVTHQSRALSLNEMRIGLNAGYVVWGNRKTFLYPMLGVQYFRQYTAWDDYDSIMDSAPPEHAMSKAGWGGLLGVGIQRAVPMDEHLGKGTKLFLGLQGGLLLLLAANGAAFPNTEYAPRPGFGNLQSAWMLVSLGLGAGSD